MNIQPIAEVGFDAPGRRKMNEIIRAMKSLEILKTPDIEVDKTSQGTFIRPNNSGGDGTDNNQAPRWG